MLVSQTALLALILLAPEPAVEIRLVEVAPQVPALACPRRTPGVGRAVVLLHGLRPHPLSETSVWQPELSGWEEPTSPLVKALAADSDVYALGYAQNATVDDVARRAPALANHILALRAAGYADVVLIGYSAGGLVARYYVENAGGGGVSKVIQVCPPNAGSGWTRLAGGVRKSQEEFIKSMSKEARQVVMQARAGLLIPGGVEFVCVVGSLGRVGDGLVRCENQWPPDLQDQGIPAVPLAVGHLTAMRTKSVAQAVSELVRSPQPRWTLEQVRAAQLRILRDK